MFARLFGHFIPQNLAEPDVNPPALEETVEPGILHFSHEEFAQISSILERHEYSLHGTIGFGGFGKVNVAVHLPTGDTVAVKIMKKRVLTYYPTLVEREISTMKSLCHQHICRLLQVIQSADWTLLVLEHCAGGDLSGYLMRGGRFSEAVGRHFFRQLLSAVSYMHERGITHGDLKPENLLVSDGYQLKLIDFGFAVRSEVGVEELTLPGGTSPYKAPERFSGKPYKGRQVDVFSMGVLLYEFLCGQLPFPDIPSILAGEYVEPEGFSDEAKSVLKAMLQRNPTLRTSIDELLNHPWVNLDYESPVKWRSVFESPIIDNDCVIEVAKHFDVAVAIVKTKIFEYGGATALFSLLLRRKLQNRSITLKSPAEMKELKVTPLVIDAGILANLIELEMQLEKNKLVKEDFVFATPIKIRNRSRLPQPTDNLSSGNWDRPGTSKTPFGAQPSAQSIGIRIDNYFACEEELDMEIDPGEVNFQVEQMAPIGLLSPVVVAAVAVEIESDSQSDRDELDLEAPRLFVCGIHKNGGVCDKSYQCESSLKRHKIGHHGKWYRSKGYPRKRYRRKQ